MMTDFSKKISFNYEEKSRYEWYVISNNIHVKHLFLDQDQYEYIFLFMKKQLMNPEILNQNAFIIRTTNYIYHKL